MNVKSAKNMTTEMEERMATQCMKMMELPMTTMLMSEENNTRLGAMEKRLSRQEAASKKAIKQFGKSVTVPGLGPGVVVTLKVDY